MQRSRYRTGDSPNTQWRLYPERSFSLDYEGQHAYLPPYLELNTVRDLKNEISKEFGVPPLQLHIEGWKRKPSSDDDPLERCTMSSRNHLNITKISETQARMSFFEKFTPPIGIYFESDLRGALSRSCFAPLHSKKLLLLFLYKDFDEFSKVFCRKLNETEVQQVLKNYSVLSWDISHEKYHELLVNVLNSHGLQPLAVFIKYRKSAAFCLQNVNGSIGITSVLYDKTSLHILRDLKNTCESNLRKVEEEKAKKDGVDTIQGFQKMIAVRLADRDYDRFEFDQGEELLKKIGFAKYGPPKNEEDGYSPKEKKGIKKLYEKITNESNAVAEYHGVVEIAFIYNCIEPLPGEKQKRSEEDDDYDPDKDFQPVPLFVLRKCRDSKNPCRIFIDDIGRVYSSWEDFINNNKLPECMIHLPRNGKYQLDKNGDVLLETHHSASCSPAATILKAVDYTSAGVGLTSGGIFLASIVIPVMPIVFVPTLVFSGLAGAYGIGRSIHTLVDRGIHKQSLSFTSSEARGAYISIVAGTLGFTGMGANAIVEKLISRGVNITNGAIYAVKSLQVANMTASGFGILNSSYEIIDCYANNENPSTLMVLQLSSSILFFGNAVYNYKAIEARMQDSQKGALHRFVNNLKANMYRRIVENITNDACTSEGCQVPGTGLLLIKGVQTLTPPIVDVIRFFQDHNQELKDTYGAEFTVNAGVHQLNGQTVDMDAFNDVQVNAFHGDLPIKSNITPEDTSKMTKIYEDNNFTIKEGLIKVSAMLLDHLEPYVQNLIVKATAMLWELIPDSITKILDNLFNPTKKYVFVFEKVFEWFVEKARKLEEQYEKWEETKDPQHYSKWFDLVNTEKKRNARKFFEMVVRECCHILSMTTRQMFCYIVTCIAKELYNRLKEFITGKKRIEYAKKSRGSPKKNHCTVCEGHYYSYDV